jgi:SNF2 family DNA or RNA helicase
MVDDIAISLTPFPYQIDGVRWMMDRELCPRGAVRGGLLCDDVGLGKSLQILLLLKLLPQARNLFIVPKSTIPQWQEYIAGFLPHCICEVLRVHKLKGQMELLDSAANMGLQTISLVTYNGVTRRLGHHLLGTIWNRVVLDECHLIRNGKTAISAFVRNLASYSRWGLSATPLQNRIGDLVNILLWLGVPRDSSFEGDDRYLDELEFALVMKQRYMLARKLDDVQHQLQTAIPEMTVETLECVLSEEEDMAYRILEHETKVRTQIIRRHASTHQGGVYLKLNALMIRMSQFLASPHCAFAGSPEMRDLAYLYPQVEKVMDMRYGTKVRVVVESVLATPHERTLVFCTYIHEMDSIMNALRERGIHVASLRGGTTDKEREYIAETSSFSWSILQTEFADLQPDLLERVWPYCGPQVLVVQIGAGGVGLNMVGYSRVIFNTLCWNPCTELQAIGRAKRIGQLQHVRVFRLAAALRPTGQVAEDPIVVEEEVGGCVGGGGGKRTRDSMDEDMEFSSRPKEATATNTQDHRVLQVQAEKRKLIRTLGTSTPIGGQRRMKLSIQDIYSIIGAQ